MFCEIDANSGGFADVTTPYVPVWGAAVTNNLVVVPDKVQPVKSPLSKPPFTTTAA
jgi:hypothetical protein